MELIGSMSGWIRMFGSFYGCKWRKGKIRRERSNVKAVLFMQKYDARPFDENFTYRFTSDS